LPYLCDVLAVHIRIQLLEQIARVFRPIVSQMLVLQEEVDAQVCLPDGSGILYREVADAGKDEVLECLNTHNTRPGIDQQDV
jgi:hypothetical protein